MLLASLALAFLAGPQAAPAADDGPVRTWENLDVMRRMLVRQIAAKRDAIAASPKKDDDGDADVFSRDGKVSKAGRRTDDGAGTNDNVPEKTVDTVAGVFSRARIANTWYLDSSFASNGEYAPGLGAIIGVTVPVRVRVVAPEPKGADAKKPAETKSADDEVWERVARGDDGRVDRRLDQLLGPDGKRKDEPRRELRYDDSAVKALKETVIDTVARFGSRLGLGRGERLAIVVTLSAGSVVREEDGGGGGEQKGGPQKGEVVVGDHGEVLEYYRGDTVSNSLYFGGSNSLALDSRTAVPGRRFVLQVSGDDLRAHNAGDLERNELVRKIRIEEFTLPSGSYPGSNNFGWMRDFGGSRPPK